MGTMSEGTRRRYSSPLRRENAEATRLRIVEAARELMLERGYAATTMADVAARAGVAVQTLYTSCPGGKAGLAKIVYDVDPGRRRPADPAERPTRGAADHLRARPGAEAGSVRGDGHGDLPAGRPGPSSATRGGRSGSRRWCPGAPGHHRTATLGGKSGPGRASRVGRRAPFRVDRRAGGRTNLRSDVDRGVRAAHRDVRMDLRRIPGLVDPVARQRTARAHRGKRPSSLVQGCRHLRPTFRQLL
jgi:hypothetical protein